MSNGHQRSLTLHHPQAPPHFRPLKAFKGKHLHLDVRPLL